MNLNPVVAKQLAELRTMQGDFYVLATDDAGDALVFGIPHGGEPILLLLAAECISPSSDVGGRH